VSTFIPITDALKGARLRKAWSRSDLSKASGVHHDTIARLERGNGGAQARTIRRLADALDVTPDQIAEVCTVGE